jgi:hypothetical protein
MPVKFASFITLNMGGVIMGKRKNLTPRQKFSIIIILWMLLSAVVWKTCYYHKSPEPIDQGISESVDQGPKEPVILGPMPGIPIPTSETPSESGDRGLHSPNDSHYNSQGDQTKARLTVRYLLNRMKNGDAIGALSYLDVESINSKGKTADLDFLPLKYEPVDLGSSFGDGYMFQFDITTINTLGLQIKKRITFYVHKSEGDWRIYDADVN